MYLIMHLILVLHATNFVSSSFRTNSNSSSNGTNKARTIQLRFKPPTIPYLSNNVASSNIRYSQSYGQQMNRW